jgi:hypothetical protein
VTTPERKEEEEKEAENQSRDFPKNKQYCFGGKIEK